MFVPPVLLLMSSLRVLGVLQILLMLATALTNDSSQCVYPPSEAKRLKCQGINENDTELNEAARRCNMLRCMACVSSEEDGHCSSAWSSACQYGKEVLNEQACRSECTFEKAQKHCIDRDPDSEAVLFSTSVEYDGRCQVVCRPKCSGEVKQDANGDRQFCCEPGTYRERVVGNRIISTCEGPQIFNSSYSWSCRGCSVNCVRSWYDQCDWQTWKAELQLDTVSSAPLPSSSWTLALLSALIGFNFELPVSPVLMLVLAFGAVATSAAKPTPLEHLGSSIVSFIHVATLDGHQAEAQVMCTVEVDGTSVFLATGAANGNIILWHMSVGDGMPVLFLEQSSAINALTAVQWNGSVFLAAGTISGSLAIWVLDLSSTPSAVSLSNISQAHFARISVLCALPSKGYIASGGFDGMVHLWKLSAPWNVGEVGKFSWPVTAIAWAESWQVLIVAGDYDEISLWKFGTDGVIREANVLKAHRNLVRGIAFASEKNMLVSVGQSEGLLFWNEQGERIKESAASRESKTIGAAAEGALWLGQGPDALVTSASDRLHLWDLPETGGAARLVLHIPLPKPVTGVVWLPAPVNLLAAAMGGSSELALIKLATKRCDNGTHPTSDFSACELCPSGMIGFNGSCQWCPAGTHSHIPSPAHAECLPCGAGRFQDKIGSSECLACPPGRMQPSNRGVACDLCPDGTTALENGQSCRSCSAGTFGRGGICFACASHMYQPLPGQVECSGPCPHGSTSNGTACEPCRPGFAGKDGLCELCPFWQLATKLGQVHCSEFCPPGEFADDLRLQCVTFKPGPPTEPPDDPDDFNMLPLVVGLLILICLMGAAVAFYIVHRFRRSEAPTRLVTERPVAAVEHASDTETRLVTERPVATAEHPDCSE